MQLWWLSWNRNSYESFWRSWTCKHFWFSLGTWNIVIILNMDFGPLVHWGGRHPCPWFLFFSLYLIWTQVHWGGRHPCPWFLLFFVYLIWTQVHWGGRYPCPWFLLFSWATWLPPSYIYVLYFNTCQGCRIICVIQPNLLGSRNIMVLVKQPLPFFIHRGLSVV